MVEFILCYLILCLSSVGTGKLYLYLIHPDRLFSFMQPMLQDMKRESTFLYKSLGGCEVCTRQRFTEFSYLVLVLLTNPFSGWVNLLHFILFILYGGLAFYFDSLTWSKSEPIKPEIKTKNIEL